MDEVRDTQQIGHFWKDEPLVEYVQAQLQEAGFRVEHVGSHYVCLSYRVEMSFNPNLEKHVRVIITLGKGFPATPPQVHFANTCVEPSLRGCCDYLVAIIGKGWTGASRLRQIRDGLPSFLVRLGETQNYIRFCQLNGQYHYKRVYSYALLKELSESGPYIAFQTQDSTVKMYVVVITASHFLIFKSLVQPRFANNKLVVPKEAEVEDLRLAFVAEMQALHEVVHSREERNEYTFVFGGEQSCKGGRVLSGVEEVKNSSICIFRKKLKITKSSQMIEVLIKSFKHQRGSIDLENAYLTEQTEEVHMFLEAKRQEQQLKVQCTRGTVHKLNQNYQKLIELYSSMGLPYQEIYLRKVSQLFAREDVRLLVQKLNEAKIKDCLNQ